jgi:hypothetical protein
MAKTAPKPDTDKKCASATAIDRKFSIRANSLASGNSYTEEEAVLFLARDRAFALTLPTYLENTKKIGAGPDQIRAVELLMNRVFRYQIENPDKVKVPDVDPDLEPQCLES